MKIQTIVIALLSVVVLVPLSNIAKVSNGDTDQRNNQSTPGQNVPNKNDNNQNRLLANKPTTPNQSLTPLSSLLNPDGTLNLLTGFQGSLDAQGWQMMTEANGQPRFIPTDGWNTQIGDPGLNGNGISIAISGSDVYAGGGFTTAGGVSANSSMEELDSWLIIKQGVEIIRYKKTEIRLNTKFGSLA